MKQQPLELLPVQIINKSKHANPEYATELSAGMDLSANLECPIVLKPAGYEVQVRPRSGLAIKKGITVLNSPGTVDADYRGEIKDILVNLSNKAWTCNDGERIAQLVVAPHETVDLIEVDTLDDTERGTGGFGHTGK